MFFCLETRGSRWYCAWGTALFSAPEEGRETEACGRSFSTATAGRALLTDIGDEMIAAEQCCNVAPSYQRTV